MRIDVQSLTTVTSITDSQNRLQGDVLISLSILPSYTLKMLDEKIRAMLQEQSEQIETKTVELLADQDNRLDPLIDTNRQADGVAIQVAQYASNCQLTCACSCHMRTKSRPPAFINRVLGQLFVIRGLATAEPEVQLPDVQEC